MQPIFQCIFVGNSSTVYVANKEVKSVQLLNLKSDGMVLNSFRANDVLDYHTVCDDVYSLCLDDGFLQMLEGNYSNPGCLASRIAYNF